MSRRLSSSLLAFAACLDACGRSPPPPAPKRDAARPVRTGVASFYDRAFAGRKTASGERLRLDGMTAASRTLPLGSKVQVVNLRTGAAAQVRINDRGPYAKDRLLDLTPKAARRIGLAHKDGLAPVGVRPAQAGGRPPP